MSDSLVLQMLVEMRDRHRATDKKVDALLVGMQEVKERLGNLESTAASLSRRLDRIDIRLATIEHRLELIGSEPEPPAPLRFPSQS